VHVFGDSHADGVVQAAAELKAREAEHSRLLGESADNARESLEIVRRQLLQASWPPGLAVSASDRKERPDLYRVHLWTRVLSLYRVHP